jgi:predicted O-linked N-acetylglucosamine transferase (SPINDLY family)
LLESAGRTEEAIASYQTLLQLQPGMAENWNTLGNLLSAGNRFEESVAAYGEAIRLRPDFAEAWSNLGDVLGGMGLVDDAIEACERAIAVRPAFAEAFNNLGNALRLRGRTGKAIAAYRRAIELNPTFVETFGNLANAMSDQGDLREAVALYREGLRLKPSVQVHCNLLVHLNACDDVSGEEIYREHREWERICAQPVAAEFPGHGNVRDPDRRVRVGYVSPDFRQHSVAYFLEPLLARHDHEQFEVFCYADEFASDEVTARLRGYADQWRTVTQLNDAELAEMVRRDQIDILVDLAGHTSNNRLLMFARKPAPVQVTYLGYPATTGLAAMDYRITDGFADPQGETEALHSERLVRLPGSFLCYRLSEELPNVAPLPALSAGHMTFGCFNKFSKVSEGTLAVWGRVIAAVTGSRLILKFKSAGDAPARERVLERLALQGIARERVELLSYSGTYAEHLALYGRVDIALDPFPYNGTTTTCEALAMGVPVIVRAGKTHVSRVGVSLMNSAGLPDWIGQTDEQYVEIATRMAGDVPALARLRTGLRERIRGSALCDELGYARGLESAYRQMWRTWCGDRAL